MKLALLKSGSPRSEEAYKILKDRYDFVSLDEADAIVSLGGDGFLLHTFHNNEKLNLPIFGMNRGTLGFLLNEFSENNLKDRIASAITEVINPVRMDAYTIEGKKISKLAFNEVSILRNTAQSANLSIAVDGKTVLDYISCDGLLVSTPAGSTAYNLSANGPVIPLESKLLALTPVSAFRPRRWRGALLPEDVKITIRNLDHAKRPIGVAADSREVKDVDYVDVYLDTNFSKKLLFDKDKSLNERILLEQFNF